MNLSENIMNLSHDEMFWQEPFKKHLSVDSNKFNIGTNITWHGVKVEPGSQDLGPTELGPRTLLKL